MIEKKSNHGFTLIELMITLVISTVIIVAIYSAYITQQKTYKNQDQVAEMQQGLRAAVIVMTNEIRMAGYDPDNVGGVGFTTANATALVFTQVADDDGEDNDGDTTIDEAGELKTIQYDLYDAYGDGINDIGRQQVETAGTSGTEAFKKWPIAENIEAIDFQYLDDTNTPTATIADIRAVQISVLARVAVADRKYTNKIFYNATGTNWGPYNDNFRRRMMITTVNCRNLGL